MRRSAFHIESSFGAFGHATFAPKIDRSMQRGKKLKDAPCRNKAGICNVTYVLVRRAAGAAMHCNNALDSGLEGR